MKKYLYKKITIFILVLSLIIPATSVKKANALTDALATAMQTAIHVAQDAVHVIDRIKTYTETVKMAYMTGKMAVDISKDLKNFDLSVFAKNLTAQTLVDISDAVLKNLNLNLGVGINVFSDGQSVVVDLSNFLDKVGVNEIKRSLSYLDDPMNTSSLSQAAKKALTEFVKNTKDTDNGKLIQFTLPYIARDEICNSPTLKSIIKNGEPVGYTRPKPPVGNINIELLCNTNLSDRARGPAAQATFVGLARAGYGGPRTNIAISDERNTPHFVTSLAVNLALEAKDKTMETLSDQVQATGMFLGEMICKNKDGKIVTADPTLDTNNSFCTRLVSSPSNSGGVLKANIGAASQGPYLGMLSKADTANDKLADGLSKAYSTMDIMSKLLKMGTSDLEDISSGKDNVYSTLTKNIGDLQNLSKLREHVTVLDKENEDLYNFGSDNFYTLTDLQDRIDLYKKIRNLNTEKLNTYGYTYTVLLFTTEFQYLAVGEAYQEALKKTMRAQNWFFFTIGTTKAKKAREEAKNKGEAGERFIIAMKTLHKEVRDLIKEMAKNNYQEQQMVKLLQEFRNTEQVDVRGSQDALAQVLDGTLTLRDYELMQEDWNYVPSFRDPDLDPYASDNDTRKYIPTDEELYGPYTAQNMLYLRVRSYNLLQVALKVGNIRSLTAKEKTILTGFGILDLSKSPPEPSVHKLTPNIERPARAPALIDPAMSTDFSEEKYCTYQNLNICNTTDIDRMTSKYNSGTESIPSTPDDFKEEKTDACLDPAEYVNSYCAREASSSDPDIQEACRNKENTIQMIRLECR